MNIGRRLKQQRESAGLDIKEAAYRVGKSYQYIRQLEEGINEPPTWELLAKLARLVIRHGKGNKKRTVYLGNAGRKYLWRYLVDRGATRTTEPLFITRKGTALSPGELLNMIVATARRAAVSHANCHRFRHTFAITFLRNGGNVLELQRLLGHEKMDTLQIYVRLAQSDLAHAQAAASPADNWGL